MALWTTPTTYATGNTLSVTAWNALANNATFLYQAPYASYYNSSATSLANGSGTQVTLGGTEYSNYSFSVSSNNVIVPLTGIFVAMFAVGAVASSGPLYAYINQNGTTEANGAVSTLNATSGGISTGSKVLKCTISDTIGLYGNQTSGGSINTSNAADNTYVSMAFIGSQ